MRTRLPIVSADEKSLELEINETNTTNLMTVNGNKGDEVEISERKHTESDQTKMHQSKPKRNKS